MCARDCAELEAQQTHLAVSLEARRLSTGPSHHVDTVCLSDPPHQPPHTSRGNSISSIRADPRARSPGMSRAACQWTRAHEGRQAGRQAGRHIGATNHSVSPLVSQSVFWSVNQKFRQSVRLSVRLLVRPPAKQSRTFRDAVCQSVHEVSTECKEPPHTTTHANTNIQVITHAERLEVSALHTKQSIWPQQYGPCLRAWRWQRWRACR